MMHSDRSAGLCSRYVLLVSGLGMGSSWCDQLSIEMMVDYITGQLGGATVRLNLSAVSNFLVCVCVCVCVCLGSEVVFKYSESHCSWQLHHTQDWKECREAGKEGVPTHTHTLSLSIYSHYFALYIH